MGKKYQYKKYEHLKRLICSHTCLHWSRDKYSHPGNTCCQCFAPMDFGDPYPKWCKVCKARRDKLGVHIDEPHDYWN